MNMHTHNVGKSIIRDRHARRKGSARRSARRDVRWQRARTCIGRSAAQHLPMQRSEQLKFAVSRTYSHTIVSADIDASQECRHKVAHPFPPLTSHSGQCSSPPRALRFFCLPGPRSCLFPAPALGGCQCYHHIGGVSQSLGSGVAFSVLGFLMSL